MILRAQHGRIGHTRVHNGHTRGHALVIQTDQAYRFLMDNNPLVGVVNRAARKLDDVGASELAQQLRDISLPYCLPPAANLRDLLARSVGPDLWSSAAPSERDYEVADYLLAVFDVRLRETEPTSTGPGVRHSSPHDPGTRTWTPQ